MKLTTEMLQDVLSKYPNTHEPPNLSKLELLIKTRRGNHYHAVKGTNFFKMYHVPGFIRFKVLGWRFQT